MRDRVTRLQDRVLAFRDRVAPLPDPAAALPISGNARARPRSCVTRLGSAVTRSARRTIRRGFSPSGVREHRHQPGNAIIRPVPPHREAGFGQLPVALFASDCRDPSTPLPRPKPRPGRSHGDWTLHRTIRRTARLWSAATLYRFPAIKWVPSRPSSMTQAPSRFRTPFPDPQSEPRGRGYHRLRKAKLPEGVNRTPSGSRVPPLRFIAPMAPAAVPGRRDDHGS